MKRSFEETNFTTKKNSPNLETNTAYGFLLVFQYTYPHLPELPPEIVRKICETLLDNWRNAQCSTCWTVHKRFRENVPGNTCFECLKTSCYECSAINNCSECCKIIGKTCCKKNLPDACGVFCDYTKRLEQERLGKSPYYGCGKYVCSDCIDECDWALEYESDDQFDNDNSDEEDDWISEVKVVFCRDCCDNADGM